MAGRGKTSSFTQEQLQTLGVGKDLPVQTAPPPTFPPLMSKPISLETTAAQNYQILWKEEFLSHMRDSPYFLTRKKDKKVTSMQRYSEQWADAVENCKTKTKPEFNWEYMPSELHITNRKRLAPKDPSKELIKKAKKENIEERLKVLEEKERSETNKEVKVKTDSDDEQNEEEEEVGADEEMDDENDYGNSYFDNGEAYNEEDDNLDDGPVY